MAWWQIYYQNLQEGVDLPRPPPERGSGSVVRQILSPESSIEDPLPREDRPKVSPATTQPEELPKSVSLPRKNKFTLLKPKHKIRMDSIEIISPSDREVSSRFASYHLYNKTQDVFEIVGVSARGLECDRTSYFDGHLHVDNKLGFPVSVARQFEGGYNYLLWTLLV